MYLVVPNGGYNADSLPVRVDLYHESAYLCLGTNKMKRLYFEYHEMVPSCTVYFVHGRYYALHSLARGEWGNDCPFSSIQKRGRA